MAQPTYHLSQKAREELDEKRRVINRSILMGILPASQIKSVLSEYNEHVGRLYASARVETNGEEMTTAWCGDCGREHRMKDDVLRYKCVCNPHLERLAAEDYFREGSLTNQLTAREGA